MPDYDGLCSADMYALKPNLEVISREFLFYLLLAPPFSAYAVDKSERNAMPKINQEALFAYEFRLPDNLEQYRIINLLSRLQVNLGELLKIQSETDMELQRFTPALLSKAFKGEL